MKTGEGWIPPSLPPVRVNQGGLNVEGHLFVTVEITIEKLSSLELISNVVIIFYHSCKVLGSLELLARFWHLKIYFSFPHPLHHGGTKPDYLITETIVLAKSLNALMTT